MLALAKSADSNIKLIAQARARTSINTGFLGFLEWGPTQLHGFSNYSPCPLLRGNWHRRIGRVSVVMAACSGGEKKNGFTYKHKAVWRMNGALGVARVAWGERLDLGNLYLGGGRGNPPPQISISRIGKCYGKAQFLNHKVE